MSEIASSSSFNNNNNGMNESKIVEMALRNNGIYVNIKHNNDIGVTPILHTLAKYCNDTPLPPMPNNHYHGVALPPKELFFCF